MMTPFWRKTKTSLENKIEKIGLALSMHHADDQQQEENQRRLSSTSSPSNSTTISSNSTTHIESFEIISFESSLNNDLPRNQATSPSSNDSNLSPTANSNATIYSSPNETSSSNNTASTTTKPATLNNTLLLPSQTINAHCLSPRPKPRGWPLGLDINGGDPPSRSNFQQSSMRETRSGASPFFSNGCSSNNLPISNNNNQLYNSEHDESKSGNTSLLKTSCINKSNVDLPIGSANGIESLGLGSVSSKSHRQSHRQHNHNSNMFRHCVPTTISINTRLANDFKRNMFITDGGEELLTDEPLQDVFEYLGDLGTGASGHVDKMRHIKTGKICAVKQMRRSGNDDENKRIYMDLGILLKCHSDNIVKCLGYFIRDTEVWICMELMTTCFDKLLRERKAPLPENFLGAIASSAVKALHYLKEEHGVIHRDVKPSNILINDEGAIKMCDFGISGRLIDSKAKTRAAGCNVYMAPERIDPHASEYDVRADVWSLGITLVELATGISPYASCKTQWNVMEKIMMDEPPRLPTNIVFSQECRNFVESCLTKDYKKRPKYKQLIEHEFVLKHKDTVVKLTDLKD